tara:strand:+ start:938 stop:2233 length:1296 start_codon:yes stop_codon:yes gene_type:complete
MALMLTAVSLSGCTGDDTELNAANERIAELESQVENDQERIAGLESEAEADEARYQKLMDDFSDDLNEEWNSGYFQGFSEGYIQGDAEAVPVSTLDAIMERGSMKCGVKSDQYGMNYVDSNGARSGLDIDYCRAIAAAIGISPDDDVEYIEASGANRFYLLADGTIDVLIRTTTWTTSRDAGLNADFAGINFYDGQGIMVRSDFITASDAGNSVYGLDGANICVGIGTTTEGNLQDWSSHSGVSFTTVNVGSSWEADEEFTNGGCDAITGDMSFLVAKKWQMENDGSMGDVDIWIGQELLSKEPLAAVTRDYDSEWNEIVSWVWYAMVTAEEMGISSTNYGSADTSDPSVDRLLYSNLGLGTDANPLPSTWVQNVLDSVGNYGEAYDRSFCDGSYDGVSGSDAMTGCLISRSGTYNALVSEGGLQYAPSMR